MKGPPSGWPNPEVRRIIPSFASLPQREAFCAATYCAVAHLSARVNLALISNVKHPISGFGVSRIVGAMAIPKIEKESDEDND